MASMGCGYHTNNKDFNVLFLFSECALILCYARMCGSIVSLLLACRSQLVVLQLFKPPYHSVDFSETLHFDNFTAQSQMI